MTNPKTPEAAKAKICFLCGQPVDDGTNKPQHFSEEHCLAAMQGALEESEQQNASLLLALEKERERADGAELEKQRIKREDHNCYEDCVSKIAANHRIATQQEQIYKVMDYEGLQAQLKAATERAKAAETTIEGIKKRTEILLSSHVKATEHEMLESIAYHRQVAYEKAKWASEKESLVARLQSENEKLKAENENLKAPENMASVLGKRGGKVGGKNRAESLSPEQRSAIASKEARHRWRKIK